MNKSTIFGLVAGLAMTAGVATAQSYTLTPAPGVATDLMTINIEFADQVFFAENNRMATAVLENVTTGVIYNCQDPDRNTNAMTEGTAYTMVFIEESEEEAEPIVAPGEYLLTVRGMYTVDAEGTEEFLDPISANYTINYPVDYTLNPADGTSAANLDLMTITINFPDNNAGFFENNRMPVATLVDQSRGVSYYCAEADRNTFATSGTEYILTFIEEGDEEAAPIVGPGNYVLSIRALGLLEDGVVEEGLPVITAHYTIEYPVNYVLYPENEATVLTFSDMMLSFPDNINIEFYENNRMPVVVLENLTTGVSYYCDAPEKTVNDGSVFTFAFYREGDEADEITTAFETGVYRLAIQGLYIANGEDAGEGTTLPVINAIYSVVYPYAYDLTPFDGAVVEEIPFVTLEFPEANNIFFYENNRMDVAILENLDTESVYVCAEPDRNTFAETEGIAYDFYFTPEGEEEVVCINEVGTYLLTIKAMYAEVDGNQDDLPVITSYIIVSNEMTGVDITKAINADNYNVYTINGVKMINNGKAEDLRNLNTGIYIVNGQKVIIRK